MAQFGIQPGVAGAVRHRGRPMTTKRERAEAKKQWLLQQKERAWIEAEIAKLEKQGDVTEAQLEELGLWLAPRGPPDLEFFMKRLNQLQPDDPQFDSKWQLALIDTVRNIPLRSRMRSLVADELHRRSFPNPERERREKRQIEVHMLECEKQALLRRGKTSGQAEKAVAEAHHITVAALRKKIQRVKCKA
jgi:hypothetical protein